MARPYQRQGRTALVSGTLYINDTVDERNSLTPMQALYNMISCLITRACVQSLYEAM